LLTIAKGYPLAIPA